MYNQYSEFVQSELKELDTKDIDQLFECIKENILEMYAGTSIEHTIDDTLLYNTIKYFLQDSLDTFLKTEREYMLADLTAIVADLKAQIEVDPAEYTERGCDEPSIDVRLCVDGGPNGYTWLFRVGLVDFDPYHSEYCTASCIGLDTDPIQLLTDLTDQINNSF